MTQFQQLGVQPWLAKQCAYMALHHPTPIQQRCIPAILGGRHVVGGAATGSGKTAAFALPILQTLANDTYGVYALVLTPSRELAYQIIDQFITFGAPLQVRTMLAIGGVAIEAQIDALKARPHVVAATPGRLHHLLQMFGPEVKRAFAHLRYLVLDEADRLTEGDMQQDVWSLLRLLPPAMKTRQVLMFTATLHPRLTSLDAPPAPDTTAAATTEDGAVPVSVLGELGITDPKTMEVVVVKGGDSRERQRHSRCSDRRCSSDGERADLLVPHFDSQHGHYDVHLPRAGDTPAALSLHSKHGEVAVSRRRAARSGQEPEHHRLRQLLHAGGAGSPDAAAARLPCLQP